MKSLLIAAAALAIAAPAAAATNLVSNGGFESNGGTFTNNFTDWSTGGWFVSDSSFVNPSYEGTYYASTGCVNTYCTISQSLATTAGASYTLSFAFNPGPFVDFGGGATLAQIDGNTLVQIIGGAQGWTVYTASFTATGATSTLAFTGFQNPSYNGVDAVSVTANVPEPAAWAMLITGFGLTGAAMRRRRAAVAA